MSGRETLSGVWLLTCPDHGQLFGPGEWLPCPGLTCPPTVGGAGMCTPLSYCGSANINLHSILTIIFPSSHYPLLQIVKRGGAGFSVMTAEHACHIFSFEVHVVIFPLKHLQRAIGDFLSTVLIFNLGGEI